MLRAIKQCMPVSRRCASPGDARTRSEKQHPSSNSLPCPQKPMAEVIDDCVEHPSPPRSLNSFHVTGFTGNLTGFTAVARGMPHIDSFKSKSSDDDVVSQSSTRIGSSAATSDGTTSPKSSNTQGSFSPWASGGLTQAELDDISVVERSKPSLRLKSIKRRSLPKRGGLTQEQLDELSVFAPATKACETEKCDESCAALDETLQPQPSKLEAALPSSTPKSRPRQIRRPTSSALKGTSRRNRFQQSTLTC